MCMQIIENVNEIIIQGYAYQDWVREIPNPQVPLAVTVTAELPNVLCKWRDSSLLPLSAYSTTACHDYNPH